MDLFDGTNVGKMVVQLAQASFAARRRSAAERGYAGLLFGAVSSRRF
jgi:hypothetical protein